MKKIIIEIDDELYGTMKADEYTFRCEPNNDIMLAIIDGIELPDDASNGDIITTMFPDLKVEDNGGSIYLHSPNGGYSFIVFDRDWWNAKFKLIDEVDCNCTDEEINTSFIEDVEAIKNLLPQTEKKVTNGDLVKAMLSFNLQDKKRDDKMTLTEFMDKRYKNRKDKDNIFGVGVSDAEFRKFIIEYLLGENWYAVDPLSREQINEIALYEILEKYSKRYKKECKNKKRSNRNG